MKTIQEIYEEYTIMPTLQLHQLRVAAVAKIICEHAQEKVDTENIVLACLFHDMGNIIKSELSRFPDFLEPQGLEYWQSVKEEYIKKYGPEEHKATVIIAREVKLPTKAFEYLQRIGFSQVDKNERESDPGFKICSYADMRVGPYGVLSMAERLAEGKKRYEGRKHTISSTDTFIAHVQSLENIEKAIFVRNSLRPEDITDTRIQQYIDSLRGVSF